MLAKHGLVDIRLRGSVVHGPARLKSPGSGSAFKGSGLEKIQAGPSVGAQARLGPAQSLGRGLG